MLGLLTFFSLFLLNTAPTLVTLQSLQQYMLQSRGFHLTAWILRNVSDVRGCQAMIWSPN
jgi:hypothetical protein